MRIVVAYDDFKDGTRTKRFTDNISQNIAQRWPCNSRLVESSHWKFDMMATPHMRELAVMDAVVADCVIIATRSDDSLPATVSDWIARWSTERIREWGILVALIGVEDSPETGFLAQDPIELRKIADRRHMKFFCHRGEWETAATFTMWELLCEQTYCQLHDPSQNHPTLELLRAN